MINRCILHGHVFVCDPVHDVETVFTFVTHKQHLEILPDIPGKMQIAVFKASTIFQTIFTHTANYE